MPRPEEITKQLERVDRNLRLYVIELEKENDRLHSQLARQRVKNTSQRNESAALKKAIPDCKKCKSSPRVSFTSVGVDHSKQQK